MKDKELFNYIKSSVDDIEINNYSDDIINNTNHQIKSTSNIKRRNIFIPLISSLVLVSSVFLISLIIILNKNDNKSSNKLNDKIYTNATYELMTLNNIIDNNDLNLKKSKQYPEDEISNLSNSIYDYIYSCDKLINNDNIICVKEKNKNTKYDYEYQMIISYDFENVYCYFNEKNSKKDKSKLEGIVLIDDIEYDFKAKLESDDDENELSMYIYKSKDEYIVIKNETETEDNEFEFEYEIKEYSKGNEKSVIEFEINIEENETEIELKKVINNIKEEYKFQIDNDEKKDPEYEDSLYFISCEAKINNYDDIDFIIYVYNDKYIYVYEDYNDVIIYK